MEWPRRPSFAPSFDPACSFTKSREKAPGRQIAGPHRPCGPLQSEQGRWRTSTGADRHGALSRRFMDSTPESRASPPRSIRTLTPEKSRQQSGKNCPGVLRQDKRRGRNAHFPGPTLFSDISQRPPPNETASRFFERTAGLHNRRTLATVDGRGRLRVHHRPASEETHTSCEQ